MYRSQGQDRAAQDAEPHDASPPTSDETGPVSASDEGGNPLHPGPWMAIRSSPTAGATLHADRKLSPGAPRAPATTLLVCTVISVVATVSYHAPRITHPVRKHLGTTLDFKPSQGPSPCPTPIGLIGFRSAIRAKKDPGHGLPNAPCQPLNQIIRSLSSVVLTRPPRVLNH